MDVAIGPECHADPDLPPARGHQERHHTVDPRGCQQERQHAEAADDAHRHQSVTEPRGIEIVQQFGPDLAARLDAANDLHGLFEPGRRLHADREADEAVRAASVER